MPQDNIQLGFGAHSSIPDYRDIKDYHRALGVPYPPSFQEDFSKIPITMQNKIGICTANLCYLIERLYEKKGIEVRLSRRFLYTVTKKYIDGNTSEGSSLRSALKAASKYGVAPESFCPTDTTLSHEDFLNVPIPPEAFTEALKYKIGGYVSVGTDHDSLAAGIFTYGGVYARMECGATWYSPSWRPADIFPLKYPDPVISGHAIALFSYDVTPYSRLLTRIKNSWSEAWGYGGNGEFLLEDYPVTEAWGVTLENIDKPNLPPASDFKHVFSVDMKYGMTNSEEVKALQTFLKIHGYLDILTVTGNYLDLTRRAVFAFQKDHVYLSWYEQFVMRGSLVGPKTRAVINSIVGA